jgi:hypothetical protein
MSDLSTLNDGTRSAVESGVIDEKEHAHSQTTLQAFPWRLDSGCELVHGEYERDRCGCGRPFGQRQGARTTQRPVAQGASLLVKVVSSQN